jgi:hypothetical protein
MRRLRDRLMVYGATATAVIFLAGLVVSLVGICFVRHPYDGWTDNLVLDAKAVATGHLQYGNPATEFVGTPYAPLFTFLFAGLLKIYWWEGWGPVLSMLAAVAAMASLVRMLWPTTPRPGSRLVMASVVVTLSLGGLSAFPRNGLFEARHDQLAWCLLVVAGTVTFQGLLSTTGLSRMRMVVTGLLLTGSVFSKQTTIVPCLLVAGLTLAVPILCESRRTWTWRKWRRAATVLATFASSSALFGIVLQVTSHGWAYDLLVDDQLRYGRVTPLGQELGTSLRVLAVPLAALVLLALCAAWSLLTNQMRYQRRHVIVAVAAVIVAISPIPTAVLAFAKLGGDYNQLAGPVWTITLGCAVLLLLLRPSVRQLAAGAIACGVLLVGIDPLSHVFVDQHLGVPNLRQQASWVGMDPFLYAAVDKGEAVFDQDYPSLSVSPKAPGYPAENVNDTLATGYTPRWLIENIIKGKVCLGATSLHYSRVFHPIYLRSRTVRRIVPLEDEPTPADGVHAAQGPLFGRYLLSTGAPAEAARLFCRVLRPVPSPGRRSGRPPARPDRWPCLHRGRGSAPQPGARPYDSVRHDPGEGPGAGEHPLRGKTACPPSHPARR